MLIASGNTKIASDGQELASVCSYKMYCIVLGVPLKNLNDYLHKSICIKLCVRCALWYKKVQEHKVRKGEAALSSQSGIVMKSKYITAIKVQLNRYPCWL